jgi:FtsH-binding integral membrane protein
MPPATGVRSPAAPKARTAMRLPHVTLNSDGKRHPVENVLSVFTLVAGLLACVAGFLANYTVTQPWAHVIATWLGLATMLIGLYSQLVSATRQERMLIVTGLVAGFVGLALGLANGGLF